MHGVTRVKQSRRLISYPSRWPASRTIKTYECEEACVGGIIGSTSRSVCQRKDPEGMRALNSSRLICVTCRLGVLVPDGLRHAKPSLEVSDADQQFVVAGPPILHLQIAEDDPPVLGHPRVPEIAELGVDWQIVSYRMLLSSPRALLPEGAQRPRVLMPKGLIITFDKIFSNQRA